MKRCWMILLLLPLLVACATPLARINGDAPTTSIPLAIDPPEAKVFLDGIYVGRAERFTVEKGGLAVTAGAHRLRLEADDFLNEQVVVTAQERSATVEVRMLPRPVPPPEDDE